MPVDEPTRYDTPIPLRRNGFGDDPNPYSRLEAVEAVRRRVESMAMSLEDDWPADVVAVDHLALVHFLLEVHEDLQGALTQSTGVVGYVTTGRPLPLWLRKWRLRFFGA